MKKIYLILFAFTICIINVDSQSLRFSYQVQNPVNGNPSQSKLIVYVQKIGGGTENVVSFNFGFYYKSTEATVLGYAQGASDAQMLGAELNAFDASYATSLGWSPDLNGSIVVTSSPPGLPAGYDRRVNGGIGDNNFNGSNIGSTPVPIVAITLLNNMNPPSTPSQDSAYQVNTVIDPAYTYSNTSFDEFPILLLGAQLQPLPVKLIDFDVNKYKERDAKLVWSTASETNSNYYMVQRSLDKQTWTDVGQVQAAGNSQIIQHYELIDKAVYNGIATNLKVYYRLEIVDLDDAKGYSPIKNVLFSKNTALASSNEFNVYPNPASDGVHVDWNADIADQPTALEFYDTGGKLIYSEKVKDQTNQQYIDFTKSNIQPGLYQLRVISGDKAIQYKQIVVGKN